MHMEKKEEKWSKRRASEQIDGGVDKLEKIRFAEVERERLFFITKTQ
ncbi:hypothetical protein T08_5102 [Trichinella sp. T8]|nr:hypothetical protein T08_5102 [Trichinella sp. T8]